MTKLLYVGKFILNEGAAGIHVYNIAQCLNEQGVEIVYLAYKGNSSLGQKIYEISMPHGLIGRLKNILDLVTGCYEFDVLRNAIREEHPTAVVLYNSTNAFTKRVIKYCKQNNIRVIVENTEWYTVTPIFLGVANHLFTKSIDRRIRKTDRSSDGVIAISKYLKNFYSKLQVPTFFLPPLFSLERESVRRIPFRPIRFVYAGSPGSKDILKPFIDSVIEYNSYSDVRVEFHIYGINHEELVAISGYPIDTKEGVCAHGRVSHEEVIMAVSHSHFTVLLRHDMRYAKAGYSTKVAESLSLGTPVICNNIGGTDVDIVNYETGLKIDNCSVDSIKTVIKTVSELTEDVYFNMRSACIDYSRNRYVAQKYSKSLFNFIFGE